VLAEFETAGDAKRGLAQGAIVKNRIGHGHAGYVHGLLDSIRTHARRWKQTLPLG